MIRNGNVELQAREEEIRFLKMQINEETRKRELLWKQLPNKRALDEELVTLQIQVRNNLLVNYHNLWVQILWCQ